ncbi:hypothetical protein F5Y13DRAFT_206438 [Hypoxylon sp. FL1857]|nr:hypothetical protein F5Y13DRAFT_206438 [Hypoxylon sp. FL1857]
MRVSIASLYQLAPLLLYSTKLSSAYLVHDSCHGKNFKRGVLVEAIESAFTWAGAADSDWDTSQDIVNLKSWLFGQSSDAEKAKSFFDNLITADALETLDQSKAAQEKIVFFCDPNVLKVEDDPNNPKNPSGKISRNAVANIDTFGDGIKDCEPTSGVSGIKAYTAREPKSNPQADIRTLRSYIMICPWYLQKMGVAPVPTAKGFSNLLKSSVRKIDIALDKIMPDGDKTGMDLIALLDHTILHELTHTNLAGNAEDLDGLNSYGWKNVRKLSARTDAYRNAESLAFFGLAVNRTQEGWQISENGNVKQP